MKGGAEVKKKQDEEKRRNAKKGREHETMQELLAEEKKLNSIKGNSMKTRKEKGANENRAGRTGIKECNAITYENIIKRENKKNSHQRKNK